MPPKDMKYIERKRNDSLCSKKEKLIKTNKRRIRNDSKFLRNFFQKKSLMVAHKPMRSGFYREINRFPGFIDFKDFSLI